MATSELDEIRAIERKWQDRWFRDRIFEPKSAGPKKFFLTTPYPYTSGPQHIGHTRTYNVADIHARFMRMNGHNVLWPMAWHITGTPILAISSCIERRESATIALYKSYVRLYEDDESRVEEIVDSFEDPWNIANYFSAKIAPDFKKMGFSIDWSRQFTTGDPLYNQFIKWQYGKLMERGLIVRGQHPVLFCTIDQNAVGEDDIAGGDVEKISIDEYVGLKFSLDDALVVTATLRPETVFAVTNLWLAPDATYVKAYVDGERWIVSHESLLKLRYQQREIAVIEEFEGRSLLGATCISPLGRKVPILPASFVDSDHGTGIVMSVPAHAPYDWAALSDLKLGREVGLDVDVSSLKSEIDAIQPISLVKIEGHGDFPAVELCEQHSVRSQRDEEKLNQITNLLYREEFYTGILKQTAEQFEGRLVRDAKQDVVEFLNSQNAASSIYETSTKGLCRCGGKVVVAIEPDQYFLNYGDPDWKQQAFELLDQLKIVPETYRAQFVQTFEWLDQRPCVRRRGLGTEFPFSSEHWIIEPLSDSVIYMALYTIIKHIRGCDPRRLTASFFDFVFLGVGDLTDVCEQTGLPERVIGAARKDFAYWYPNDHRHTAIAHISNHLSFFLFHHAILFPQPCWPKIVSLNELLVREGVKMSKSKGNVIPIATVPEVYSADLVRLCLVSIADLNSTVDWREQEVEMVKKRLLKFWHAVKTDVEAVGSQYKGPLSFASRWILAATNAMVLKASEAANQFSYRKYVTEAFFEHLNRVEEYKSMMLEDKEKRKTLRDVIEIWLRVLAPVIPHTAEELWERMGKPRFISLAAFPRYDDLYVETLAQKGFLDNVMADISNIEAAIKRKTESVFVYLPAQWKYSLCHLVQRLEDLSLKNIMAKARNDVELRQHLSEVARVAPELVTSFARPASAETLDFEVESETLYAAQEYMARKLGKTVHISVEAKDVYDPANRAKRALPGKPAIYFE
ncbi:MAG TPA: leucine--tRNA ligase [Candidatus Bathyarchaeia archaeon]|nr:leucine--tRNA ligase [Candidatus Bathyarchaeia archaeon]